MNRDFAEMLDALSAAEAEFLIVGPHALAAHGRPRAIFEVEGRHLPFPARISSATRKPSAARAISPTSRIWDEGGENLAGPTGLEPATSGVTGRRSNQLNYDPAS